MAVAPRIKMMIEGLYEELAVGNITDSWEEEFVDDMYRRLQNRQSFTGPQINKIEELFDR